MKMCKYYLIDWPESQEWMDCEEAIASDDGSYFVPCELYDNKS